MTDPSGMIAERPEWWDSCYLQGGDAKREPINYPSVAPVSQGSSLCEAPYGQPSSPPIFFFFPPGTCPPTKSAWFFFEHQGPTNVQVRVRTSPGLLSTNVDYVYPCTGDICVGRVALPPGFASSNLVFFNTCTDDGNGTLIFGVAGCADTQDEAIAIVEALSTAARLILTRPGSPFSHN